MATPCRQVVRHFTTSNRLLRKINVQCPAVPWTERRILNAVTVPVFPPDTRPLPIQCYDARKQKKESQRSELAEAYLAFRLKMAIQMFFENKMVVICHRLPMQPRHFFYFKTKIVRANMSVMFARNDIAMKAILNTKLHNLEPYLTSDNLYIVSPDNKVQELLAIVRRVPEVQLLGGVVEDRILTRSNLMDIAKLPTIDVMRGELVTILSASASKTSRLLSRHQQELTISLDQLVKQGGGESVVEDKQAESVTDQAGEGDAHK